VSAEAATVDGEMRLAIGCWRIGQLRIGELKKTRHVIHLKLFTGSALASSQSPLDVTR
jgi:hypothetical protein